MRCEGCNGYMIWVASYGFTVDEIDATSGGVHCVGPPDEHTKFARGKLNEEFLIMCNSCKGAYTVTKIDDPKGITWNKEAWIRYQGAHRMSDPPATKEPR